MSTQQPGGSPHNAGAGGTDGGPGIGQIIGNPLFIGTSNRERDHRSPIWNWVPCGLVFLAVVVALIREPDGPRGQFVLVYALLGVPFLVAFLRATVGVDWSRPMRAMVSWAAVLVAVLGCLTMEDLRDRGKVDVTGRAVLKPDKNLGNGDTFILRVLDSPRRSRLRLVLDTEDTDRRDQNCSSDTRFVLPLPGGSNGVESKPGTPYDLTTGDNPVKVRITLHTTEGCLMTVSVARAVLYD